MPLKKENLIFNCFRCSNQVIVKFVPPRKDYAQKNNWGYWTESVDDAKKYICDDCLNQFYYREYSRFLETIKSKKKINLLRVYLSIMNSRSERI